MNSPNTALENAIQAMKIALDEPEKEQLARDLEEFERWVSPLLTVDTTGVEPALYNFQTVNVFRPDRPAQCDRDRMQSVAGSTEHYFYRVPPIIE